MEETEQDEVDKAEGLGLCEI